MAKHPRGKFRLCKGLIKRGLARVWGKNVGDPNKSASSGGKK